MVQIKTRRPTTKKPPDPRHPGNDAMPPYAPGGVPAPTGEPGHPEAPSSEPQSGNRKRSSYYPPKMAP